MKKVIYIGLPLLLLTLVVVRLKSNKQTSDERVYRYDRVAPVGVQADTLALRRVNGDYFLTGSFEAERETRLSAEVQGKIETVYVDAGTSVKKGQPLIQLDNSLLKLQLENVNVQIEGLESDVNRYSVLVGADAVQGVQLEKAELGLKSAHVQRMTLLEQIEKTTVRAPFSGIVTAKLSEAGAFAAPGVPLLQLTDISRLRFTVQVPETELPRFSALSHADILSDVFPDIVLRGTLVMIGSKANPANSFPVQFAVDNTRDLRIRSGMFGRVTVKGGLEERALVIPASAVVGSAVRPQVYRISDGRARLRDITISRRVGNEAIVAGGLSEGDVIVTGGFINLSDGSNVEVTN